jgi:hypothetical protein
MPGCLIRRKINRLIENKRRNGIRLLNGKFQNCAMSGTVAQFSGEWRKLRGATATGGASVPASRPPNLFSAPHQIKHPPLERPVFNPLDPSFPKWIFLHINPFLGIILAITQPMMPSARLKFPFLPAMLEAELAFTIGNPSFNREMQISRRAKQMQMIRHQ